jgi:hypothetical protein
MARSFLKFCETNPDAAAAMLDAAGNKIAALRRRGICTHGWLSGPPGKPVITCNDCGATFETYAARDRAARIAMGPDT